MEICDYKVLVVCRTFRPEDINDYQEKKEKLQQELEELVRKAIADGFQPLGGVSITSKAPDCDIYLAQAIVKYK